MWELDHKEGLALKNWCFCTVVLEKTLERPLDSNVVKPVHPKGNQLRIFIGRTDVEAEALILRPSDMKSWLVGKDPDAGKDWGQEEKRATEDEMVGWHHYLNGHEFEQTLGDSEGQGSLACCSPWRHKESDTTETEQQQWLPWILPLLGAQSFSGKDQHKPMIWHLSLDTPAVYLVASWFHFIFSILYSTEILPYWKRYFFPLDINMLSLSVMFLSTPSSKYLQHTAIMVFYPELPLLKELIL